ncbi:hypothetical protein ABZ695_05900 [Streptomyces sp. NPDC006976]|uniref:hypothetical protein n=1 Tax=Streptomyces sp. NPDC006976 TaxID=3154311 RepID=UPI0034082E53
MTALVQEPSWYGEPAVRLRAPWGSVVVLPERGAKIASLRDASGHEWLAQPAHGPLAAPDSGVPFAEAEMCGWDEIAPTLRSEGMPDHGEVWAVPWTVVGAGPDFVELQVPGSDVPFLLRRRLQVTAEGLRMEYSARALEHPVYFLWMAHPQFRAPAGTEIDLGDSSVTMCGAADRDGHGTTWGPEPVDPFTGVPRGTGRKWWCAPGTAPDHVRVDHACGRSLTLSWSGAATELAVWADHCWRSREPVLALEPATSNGDDVVNAAHAGTAVRLDARTWVTWSLGLSVHQHADARSHCGESS